MTGCPFGFAAEAADGSEHDDSCECAACSVEVLDGSMQPLPVTTELELSSSDDELPDMCGGVAPQRVPRGTGQRKKPKEKKREQFETDPSTWFSGQGIKNEADFQARKADLQAEARRRLASLDAARARLRELDPDMDSDSDLSDYDADTSSLRSIGSAAREWADAAAYSGPARRCIKVAAPVALVASLFCIYQASAVMAVCTKVAGVVQNTHWAAGSFSLGGLAAVSSTVMFVAADWRSKRMALAAQAALLVVHAAACIMLALMTVWPTAIDARLYEHACTDLAAAGSPRRELSRMCQALPGISETVQATAPALLHATAAVGVLALGLVCLGVWYAYEIAFVEKKGLKHHARAQRTRHAIPWSKITVRDTAAATASWVSGTAAKAKDKDA